MRRRVLIGAAALVATAAIVTVVVASGENDPGAAAPNSSVATAKVQKGALAAVISVDGTLTYQARSDGSPYSAINQAHGTYTQLPQVGDRIDCGDIFYRVDDRPVLLLCGAIPAYRTLRTGEHGKDVRQLNQNLHQLGYDVAPHVDDFTWRTQRALEKLQHDTGSTVTGRLSLGDAVVLPKAARIGKLAGQLGSAARPGTPVAQATSDTLEVRVDLAASQQGAVKAGDRAQITLPDNASVNGKVDRLGRVAHGSGKDTGSGDTTISAYLTLDQPADARGLDSAPVRVQITTKGVGNALSVPVIAIVGKAGGGFAVEVVRTGGHRELVTVTLGLFDDTSGRVQVHGDLAAGDDIVVPSS